MIAGWTGAVRIGAPPRGPPLPPLTIRTPPHSRRIAAAAAAVAFLAALTGCSSADINDDYTDVEVLSEFEARIAASVEPVEDFPGFGTRFRELRGCYYGEDHNDQNEDEDHSTVSTRYTLADEVADDSVVQELAAAFDRQWTELGWEVDPWRDEGTGDYIMVRGTSEDGITLLLQAAAIVSLDAFHSGCVAIDDDPIPADDPVGGVPADKDQFQNLSNRSNPDDEV